jgi:hypothetical protein
VIDVLEREAASGFPHLSGARLSGTLQLTEKALNDWLRQSPQLPPGVALTLHDGNRLVVRYGIVQATAMVEDEIAVGRGAPVLRVVLASALLAWGLRQLLRTPGVAVDGRVVTIDLGVLDRDGRYRSYWPLLCRARLRTAPRRLHVDIDVAVT